MREFKERGVTDAEVAVLQYLTSELDMAYSDAVLFVTKWKCKISKDDANGVELSDTVHHMLKAEGIESDGQDQEEEEKEDAQAEGGHTFG